MIQARLGTSAGLLLTLVAPVRGLAQSADTPPPIPTAAASSVAVSGPVEAGQFDAAHDSATIVAADSLGLAGGQRKIFFDNVQALARDALMANPGSGRETIDASLGVVVRETGRKVRFIRQARVLFGEMYQRRKGDDDLPPGTEDELWRSQRNIEILIALYRKNPEASDYELERAMAPSFKAQH